MYKMYDEYLHTLKNARKTVAKRQKLNTDMREKYGSPFGREDYERNRRDITEWNSMIRDLEEDIKMIEMYLEFNDRTYLHREYNNMKSMILNKNSYEGEIPTDCLCGFSIPDTTDIVSDVELQEEIVDLLSEVLTDRQKQVVQMYFWDGLTQEKIARELGVDRVTVTQSMQNSLEKLRKCEKIGNIGVFNI